MKPNHAARVAGIALFLALQPDPLVSSCAGDWPQFRGPSGDGLSAATNLPLSWSEKENVAWKVRVPGRGRSSPVVSDGRIWLTTAFETGIRTFAAGPDRMQQADAVSFAAVCLDQETGSQLHCVELFSATNPPPVNFLNSYATPTPVAEPGRVYCDFGAFGTACLAAGTGDVIWKRRLEVDHHQGPGSSPVLYNNLLVLVRDGRDQQYIVALEKATGEIAWRTSRPPMSTPVKEFRKSFSTPLIFEHNGVPQMVIPGAQWLVAYDPMSGKEIWRADDLKGETVAPRPVYGNGLVYLSTGVLDGRAQLWAVRVDGHGDITSSHVAWKLQNAIGFMPSPLLVGGDLFALNDDGFVSCADARTGEVRGKARLGGTFAASPVFAEGRIYCFGRDGQASVLAATKDLPIVGAGKLDGSVFASPAIVDSSIYTRNDEHLYRLSRPAPAAR